MDFFGLRMLACKHQVKELVGCYKSLDGLAKPSACVISEDNVGGFTLLEVLVTMALFAIIIGFAVPNFSKTFQSVNLNTVTADLGAALKFSRSEAIRRSGGITICASVAPSVDKPECSGQQSWSNGWIVLHDLDGDGKVGPKDSVLRRYSQITSAQLILSVDNSEIRYLASGLTDADATEFVLCSARAKKNSLGFALTVDKGGNVQVDQRKCP